jgi:class 3 adenylate cyclase
MMDIVNDYEGLVFNTAGDELMISFNVPYTQEDVNLRALDAAIAMQGRFGGMQSLWREEQIDLGMGIGINRGMVVLGHVGGRHRMTYTMVGEAVNLAHRLVEIADDAQIVMTEEIVADGMPDDVRELIKPMPPAELKGITSVHPLLMIDTGR